MIKSFKVMLHPTKEQLQLFLQSSGIARWTYNWTLERQQENYKKGNGFISHYQLKKELTVIKKTPDYTWLNDVSAQVSRQAVIDACNAFMSFFRKQSKFPKFKSRKRSKPSFYHRYDKLRIVDGRVKLEKIGWVDLAEPNRIPTGEYHNPRITNDGLNWYLSVGIGIELNGTNILQSNPVGIDLGIKSLAVVSNGKIVSNINKSKEVKRLSKKLKRLQRQASKHYKKIKGGGIRYEKSRNLIKLEKEVLKIHKRLKNIRVNHTHNFTTKIVKSNPEFIVIEDLNVSGMMKNKHLSRAIQDQGLYEVRRQFEYKCEWNNVRLILADRWYPSSKMCSNCGNINKNLNLSTRKYTCSCGYTADRDLNASINLRNYGLKLVS